MLRVLVAKFMCASTHGRRTSLHTENNDDNSQKIILPLMYLSCLSVETAFSVACGHIPRPHVPGAFGVAVLPPPPPMCTPPATTFAHPQIVSSRTRRRLKNGSMRLSRRQGPRARPTWGRYGRQSEQPVRRVVSSWFLVGELFAR